MSNGLRVLQYDVVTLSFQSAFLVLDNNCFNVNKDSGESINVSC